MKKCKKNNIIKEWLDEYGDPKIAAKVKKEAARRDAQEALKWIQATKDESIDIGPWFAWRPVRVVSGEIVWLKPVIRVVDNRPEIYLGLLPTTDYYLDLWE